MNPKIYYPVGRRIRNLRKRHRITQEQLAAWLQKLHAPVTRDVVANWETGRGDVPAYCIQLISYWLRAKVTDLLPDLTCQGQIAIHVIHPSGRRVRQRQPTRPAARASA